MKTRYRGYEINVRREKSLAGYALLYTTIIRESDQYVAVDTFEDSAERVADMAQHMRQRIDAELAESDPWGEQEEADLT